MLLINESEEYSSRIFETYKLNLNWIAIHYEKLLLEYENHFVAVNDKKVFDSDKNLQRLLKRVESNNSPQWKTIAIMQITQNRKGF